MKTFLVAFGLSTVASLGLMGLTTQLISGHKPTIEFPMSPLELQNARGLAQRVNILRNDIARVASGNQNHMQEFLQVAEVVQALDHDDEELRREAERRLGVAVIQSGSVWVPK